MKTLAILGLCLMLAMTVGPAFGGELKVADK